MEDEFSRLIEKLGYRVLRKRDPKSGLDIIAQFLGEPIPSPSNLCQLERPQFSPDGVTCFSLKSGDFVPRDIEELVRKRESSKNDEKDKVLASISGAVMVTNFSKTETDLELLRSKNDVYCWDIRRLLFYSKKANLSLAYAARGRTWEKWISLDSPSRISSIIQTETGQQLIRANIGVFVDDHSRELILSRDHVVPILESILEKTLEPITQTSKLPVHAAMQLHTLGIADKETIIQGYREFAGQKKDSQVTFGANLNILQYGAAPWAVLFADEFL